MPKRSFRLFFSNKPAPRRELDRVEEITVEQEMGMAWEARIKFNIKADQRGVWSGGIDKPFTAPFARLRVEMKVGNASPVALIDGPVVGKNTSRSSEPGQSTLTLIARDDSVYLHREEEYHFIEGQDHEVARQLFTYQEHLTDPSQVDEVDQEARADDDLPPVVVWRGTAMQLLKQLAKRRVKPFLS